MIVYGGGIHGASPCHSCELPQLYEALEGLKSVCGQAYNFRAKMGTERRGKGEREEWSGLEIKQVLYSEDAVLVTEGESIPYIFSEGV